jgi:hypothetical protein
LTVYQAITVKQDDLPPTRAQPVYQVEFFGVRKFRTVPSVLGEVVD